MSRSDYGRTYRDYQGGKSATGYCMRCREGKEERTHSTGGAKPGMDIIATKWIGLEGTAIIAHEKEEELCTGSFFQAFCRTGTGT